jgi:MoxR-like ATPase
MRGCKNIFLSDYVSANFKGLSMNFIQKRDALHTTEEVSQPELLNSVPDQKTIDPNGSVFLIKKYQKAIEQVKNVVLGKDEQIELMFVALLAKGHVLLDDLPGMGKTTMARTLAAVLGLDLQRIQFTSDLMPSDVLGMNVYQHGVDGQSPITHFQHGPIFTNLLLADEINRASPRTQSALLEAMAEQQVTLDGVTYHLPHPFWVIATQNPVDYSGTFPLPDSQMDRFMFRMSLGYPDDMSELSLLLGKSAINRNKMSAILS